MFLLAVGWQGNAFGAQHDAWIARAIKHSPAWKRVSDTARHPFYMIEGESRTHVTLYIGEDLGTHTVRWDTLKVFKSGKILRLADSLNDTWIVDFAPPKAKRPPQRRASAAR